MKVFVAVFMLLFPTLVEAVDQVAQKIDAAIEFANAGRGDLALQQFQRLLQTALTPIEKASVLYNSAVIFASSDRFWEGLLALNQIDDDMFSKVLAASPLKAVQIAYNGALCSVNFAKSQMQKFAASKTFTQHDLDAFSEALSSAKHYSKILDELSQKKVIGDLVLSSFIGRIALQEDIANLSYKLAELQQRLSLELLDKTALLDELGGLLQQQFYSVLTLYLANNVDRSHIGLYMKAYSETEGKSIFFCIDRLLVFLQAPAKKKVAGMRTFLTSQIEQERSRLQKAVYDADLVGALCALDQLSALVLLVQAEPLKTEIAALLDMRIRIAMEFLLAQDIPKKALVWQRQWEAMQLFTSAFLAKKASLSDEMNASLITLLQKRLLLEQTRLPGPERVADDAFYWKVLSEPENTTYVSLATALHAAATADQQLVAKTVGALLDRVGVLQVEEAIVPLKKMLQTDSALLMFQDLVESWVYVDPKSAFSFILGLLSDECSFLHLYPGSESFTAKTDYHLLMRLLSVLLKTEDNRVIALVYDDLMQRGHWFSDQEKSELDFFAISLQLAWLKELFTGHVDTLEGITNAVDFGLEFQKKTMLLLRFAQKPEFQELLDLLSQMQEKCVSTIQDGLHKLSAKGPKIKQVIALIADAQRQVIRQNKELASMQAVLNDLEQASKILHSMKSESKAESQASTSSQAPQPSPLQKQALKLSPELSIRLLQEMQQQDKSLQTQNIPQVSGLKPW